MVEKRHDLAQKKVIPVQPFYQQRVNPHFKSPLQEYIRQIVYVQNANLTKFEVKEHTQSKRGLDYWKGKFSHRELNDITTDFENLSYEGVISQKQLLKYLKLEQ